MKKDSVNIKHRGKRISVRTIEICGKSLVVTGKFIKIAQLKYEWLEDVQDPDLLIQELRTLNLGIDIFTFTQRFPKSRPEFTYSMEWENVAAIPVTSYDYWLKKQIHQNPRNKIKIATKKGVSVKTRDFTDDFLKEILEIYHEVPVRQNKPFHEYGIDFNTLKTAHSTFLESAIFIGAYYKNELIGFAKLVSAGDFMRTMGILAKVRHRDKAVMNLLIAKAVEICGEKGIPYLIYGNYDYGKVGRDSLKDFKRYNGFEGILLPRYYEPFTLKGATAIKFGLHHGIIGVMPEPMIRFLLEIRDKYYSKKN